MTNSKTKVPAKKALAKAQGKAPAVSKVLASEKPVKAPLIELKKTIPARKPANDENPELTIVSAPVKSAAVKTAKKKASSAKGDSKVRIFQFYYQTYQRQHLDPAFEPYNNVGDSSPLFEFNVFRKLMNSELLKGVDLWGALPWEFAQKTGMNGAELREIISRNPGYDIYYCNPYPEIEAMYHNLWLQGETSHPNFLILCRDFFEAAGLPTDALTSLQASSTFAAANYFVASPNFWDGYVKFINHAIERANKNMSSTARAMIYSSVADQAGLHAGANYLPFIIERLLSLYLEQAGNEYKAFKVPLKVKDEQLNVHLQLLKQMKDMAVNSRSLWLATCWVNYRNLYMSQYHGRDWCQRYLKTITPTSVQFGGEAKANKAGGKK